MGITLFLLVFLLAANAFFVAAEFALVKARAVRLEKLAEAGHLRARLTLDMLRDIDSYLAACQLGITMASLGLGWIGEPFVASLLEPLFRLVGLSAELLHTSAFLAGFLIFSALHIVLGEQVPKTFAIREPNAISLWVAVPLYGFYLAFFPLNWLLDRAARGVLAALGARPASHGEVYTLEELRSLVGIAHRYGRVPRQERDMIAAILDLAEVEVGDVMTHRRRMETLDADLPPEDIVQRVIASSHSRFPVWRRDPDRILGIVHAKDVLAAAYRSRVEGAPFDLTAIASAPWFVPETASLLHQLLEFRRRRQHMALVVDEYGGILGLVTLEDILEEIVGDIFDEKDIVTTGIRAAPDGSVLVAGEVTVRDLNRKMDWDLPEEPAATVAGLVIAHAERIPAPGERFVIDGFEFEVLDRSEHRLTRLRIRPRAAGRPQQLAQASK